MNDSYTHRMCINDGPGAESLLYGNCLETRVQSDSAHACVECHDVCGGALERQCNMQCIKCPQRYRLDIEQKAFSLTVNRGVQVETVKRT